MMEVTLSEVLLLFQLVYSGPMVAVFQVTK